MEIDFLDEVTSTQDLVKERIKRGESMEAFAICAKRQTAGYGKQGRAFYSPARGLYLTVALPEKMVQDSQILTLAVGVKAAELLMDWSGNSRLRLKWVNDLYLDDHKIGGILTEKVLGYYVVGVGVNIGIELFPEELAEKAASLLPGADFDRDFVVQMGQAVLAAAKADSQILADYRRLSYLTGKQVTLQLGHGSMSGIVQDIDDQGCLLLASDGKILHINSGEVTKVNFA